MDLSKLHCCQRSISTVWRRGFEAAGSGLQFKAQLGAAGGAVIEGFGQGESSGLNCLRSIALCALLNCGIAFLAAAILD